MRVDYDVKGFKRSTGGTGFGLHAEMNNVGAIPPDRTAFSAQVSFHREADTGRFFNRLRNPFLVPKEASLARLVAGGAPASGSRILEVGCGEGSNLWFLSQEHTADLLVGVDLSPAKVGFLKEMQPRVISIAADVLHLPFTNEHFDVVMCRDLLHHVNWNRPGVVVECIRVLKPGGQLVVFEGCGQTLLNRTFQMLVPAERGMRDSTRASVEGLLAKFGPTEVVAVEASSAIRAVGYFVGWPQGPARILALGIYRMATAWERLVAAITPRRRWVYQMYRLSRP